MLAAQASPNPKFLRKTALRDSEANTNFKMLDNDVAEAITSAEADEVTPLMSKIYTRLLLTPEVMREGERVLRFAGEEREGKWVTAWEQLRGHLRVSGETASKALRWMHGQGIIGYCAGKNGVGIRIFLNRAASSVAQRATRAQKILPFGRAAEGGPRTSPGETPFKDSFADPEVLDSDIKSRAPKNGADKIRFGETASVPPRVRAETGDPTEARRRTNAPSALEAASTPVGSTSVVTVVDPTSVAPTLVAQTLVAQTLVAASSAGPSSAALEEIVLRLKSELEGAMQSAARQAAAREHERTRAWLETRGLPKAARVAQHEAYNVLRKYGVIGESPRGARARSDVGRGMRAATDPHPLSSAEVDDLAQACVALLETQGQSVERTLSEMCVGAGGFLLPPDALKVRERAEAMLDAATLDAARSGAATPLRSAAKDVG